MMIFPKRASSLLQEAHMRRGVNITVALILIALIIKMVGLPNHTVASTDVTAGQKALSVYDLDMAHPNMKDLPQQEAPQP